jgi:hypothetical protein
MGFYSLIIRLSTDSHFPAENPVQVVPAKKVVCAINGNPKYYTLNRDQATRYWRGFWEPMLCFN